MARHACGQRPAAIPLAGFEATGLESPESEEEDEIETDRDSFTPSTTTAGNGRVIFESAYSFIDNRSVPETHSFPELLVRRGVCDWLELRLGWNYEVGGAGSPISGNVPSDLGDESELERESRMLYGLKALLTDQHQWIPESAVLLQGYTPTSGAVNDTQMSATYIFGWTSTGGAGLGLRDPLQHEQCGRRPLQGLVSIDRLEDSCWRAMEGACGVLWYILRRPRGRDRSTLFQSWCTLFDHSQPGNRCSSGLGPERRGSQFLFQRRRGLAVLNHIS